MTDLDQIVTALCAWKENRGAGITGMQSVINVVLNRAAGRNMTPYAVVYEPLQFSSMSYQHDPQLLKQPGELDLLWSQARDLVAQAADGKLGDITGGATNYYALSIPPPSWVARMTQTAIIGGQAFYK